MTAGPWRGRIAVVGCGALGALYGLKLHHAGNDVHLLARSDFDAARKNGYTLTDPDGKIHNFHPPVYQTPAEIGVVDMVLVGLKTTDNAALPALLAPLCGPETLILTLQNGIGNEEILADLLGNLHGGGGADRVLGGVAFLCSNRIAPAHIHHIDQGWIHLAEHGGPARERTHAIAAMFHGAAVKCIVYDSLVTIRWQKLAWNIPFNALSVLANHADTRTLLDDPWIRPLIPAIMSEVATIAAADGAILTKEFLQELIDVTEGIGRYKTSMLLDHESNRPLEIDAILGEPLRRAHHHQIPTPHLELLHALLRRVGHQK